MVAPAIAAAARIVAKKVATKVAPRVASTSTAKAVKTAAAPALAKIGIKSGRSKTIVADAAKKYYSGASKGASISAGTKLASKVIPKSKTGKIIAAATIAPVAKDLYGKLPTSSRSGSGGNVALTSRNELAGGFSEVGGVEGGAFEAMPTVGSAARIGALPQVQSLIADPKIKAALVGVGLVGAAAEALGVIDVIPGVGRPKAKTAAKKRKTTAKKKKATSAKKRAAGATFKALAAKWKKLSPQAKARYEGRFSEYIKVHREKAIASKSKPRPKKRTTKKRTTKTKRKTGGKRRQTAAVKKQQSKMRAAAKKWKSYKGNLSYQAFMSRELKR